MASINELKIIFWNSRGLRNKFLELKDLILEEEADIIGINETFLCDNVSLPHITGFNFFRIDKTNHAGGLLLIIKEEIPIEQIQCPDTILLECIEVKVLTQFPFNLF